MANTDNIFDLKKERDDFYDFYQDYATNASAEELAFGIDLFDLVMSDDDKSKVTAVPAPCGIGKSRFTQAFITYCVVNKQGHFKGNNCIPLVVVTDKLERLDTINVFWSCKTFKSLNILIEERFGKNGYGAQINYMGIPAEMSINKIASRKTKTGQKSRAQKIVAWMKEQAPYSHFKIGTMLEETQLQRDQYRDARKSNSELDSLFRQNIVDASKGIYSIPQFIQI